MKVLLDTHAFLWWNDGDAQLSRKALRVLSDPANTLMLSVASAWEMAIKTQTGKLRLPEAVSTYVPSRAAHYGMEILPIQLFHALALESLPSHHRDPFDRILIAQAQVERVAILSIDSIFRKYPIESIW